METLTLAPERRSTGNLAENPLLNRELSWIEFNSRVLDEALRPVDLTNQQFSLLMSLNRPEPPPIGPVANLLGMDRTTLTAALKPLERRGLVQRVASRRYAIGNELYFLAFGGSLDHLVVVRTTLAELVKLTGESASFSILHGDSYYCAMQHSSPHDLSYCPTQGEQYPLNAGATGAALLAFQPQARLDAILERLPLPAFTERTISSTLSMSRSFGLRHAAPMQKRVAPLSLACLAASSTVSMSRIFLASTPVS